MTHLRQIRRGLTFLLAVFVAAVLGYMALTGCGLVEAIYFVVITMSTVGYGEETTRPAPVQLFTIGVILVGGFAGAYTFALVIQSMVEGRINQALGARRMNREIEKLTGHAVICGYGRIGRTIAAELARRKKPYVILDQNHEIVEQALEDHLLAVVGDATEEETLLQAGIMRAETLVVALQSDANNVFLTLTGRNLNPKLRIIARGEQAATEKKLRQAGADQVVLPAVIGGRRMAALVTRPNAAEMLEHFTNHERIDVELEELRMQEGSPLVGKSVRETAARQRHNLLIVGIRRAGGEMLFNPDADHLFETGDTLVVMGRSNDVATFEKALHLTHDDSSDSVSTGES